MSATANSDCEKPGSLAVPATRRCPSACAKICSCNLVGALFYIFLAAGIGVAVWSTIKDDAEYKCPDFTINGAYLSQFSYTESSHTLSYNLALNITLTNPKKKLFDTLVDVKVSAYYQEKRIGQVTLVDLPMSTSKNTTVFQNVVVQGHDMLFEESVIPAADLYSIDVVITFQDKNNVQRRGHINRGEVIYNLRLPLSFNGTSWDADKTAHCPKDN